MIKQIVTTFEEALVPKLGNYLTSYYKLIPRPWKIQINDNDHSKTNC